MSAASHGVATPLDPPESDSGDYFGGGSEIATQSHELPSTYHPSSYGGGTSATRRRKKQRHAAKTSAKMIEEESFCKRFNRMEFLGRQDAFKTMKMELALADHCAIFVQYCGMQPFPDLDLDACDDIFVRANPMVELNHLEYFNRQYTPYQAKFAPAINAAIDQVTVLSFPDELIPFPSKLDLAKVRYYGDRYPGVEYRRMGYLTRAEANNLAQMDAERAWDELMKGVRVAPHLVRMGGRGKHTTNEKVRAAGDKVTTGRLIMMTSQRDLKLCGVTERLLTNDCKKSHHPVAIGRSWFHGGSTEFAATLAPFDRFFCFDASKFDSSIPVWLVEVVVKMLRGFFLDGRNHRYDAYWAFVVESMTSPPMFLDNGLVFKRRGGSTSGHNHNTLIQSYCTLIIGYTCLQLALPDITPTDIWKDVYMESMGDDQIMALRGVAGDVDFDRIITIAMEVFGIDWGGAKSFETGMVADVEPSDVDDSPPNRFMGVQFLGKYFKQAKYEHRGEECLVAIPYRPARETGLRLLYPEYGEPGLMSAWMRAIGHYVDAAGNDVTRAWLEGYLDWLEPQLPVNDVAWSEYFRRKHTRGLSDEESPIPARRLSYEEWLEIVHLPPEARTQRDPVEVPDDLVISTSECEEGEE